MATGKAWDGTAWVEFGGGGAGGGGGTVGSDGAEVRLTADQSITSATWTPVSWDAEEYDDAAFWEGVTNPTRITFAAAGRYLVVFAGTWLSFTGTDFIGARLIRNGNTANELALSSMTGDATVTPRNQLTAVVDAQAGDYVELEVYQDSGSAQNLSGTGSVGDDAETTRLFVARLSGAVGTPVFSGARATLTADEVIPNNTETAIPWDAVDYDTDSYWAASPNPTRFTVPTTGKYLVTGHIQFDPNNSGVRRLSVYVDGTRVNAHLGTANLTGFAAWLTIAHVQELTAGQYVEIYAYQDSGGDLNVDLTRSHATITKMDNVAATYGGLSVVGTDTDSASDASATVTIPAGTAENDLVMIFVGSAYDVSSTPAGFTELDAQFPGSNIYGHIFWKYAGPSDASTNVTINFGGSFAHRVILVAIDGTTTSGDPGLLSSDISATTMTSLGTSSGVVIPGEAMLKFITQRGTTALTFNTGTDLVNQNTTWVGAVNHVEATSALTRGAKADTYGADDTYAAEVLIPLV